MNLQSIKCLLIAAIMGLSSVSCRLEGNVADANITEDTNTINEGDTTMLPENNIELFGVKTQRNHLSILKDLSNAGVLVIDSIIKKDSLIYAIGSFANVRFGINPSHDADFSFITSEFNEKSLNNLIEYISRYYGEPSVDCDYGDPLYNYYLWDNFKIRPLHSETGGLVMFWDLSNRKL